jgi:hypothetical protein
MQLTKQQWAVCAAVISSGTGRPIPREQLEVYYELLQDMPFDVLKQACRMAIQSQEANWLPHVGLIRRFGAEVMYGVLPLPEEAWRAVAIAYHGTWHSGEVQQAFDSLPLFTQQVLKVSPYTGVSSFEDKFIRTYSKMAKREMEMRKLSFELRPEVAGNVADPPKLEVREPGQPSRRFLSN